MQGDGTSLAYSHCLKQQFLSIGGTVMVPKRTRTKEQPRSASPLPGYAQIIAEIGPKTAAAVEKLVSAVSGSFLINRPEDFFPALAEAFRQMKQGKSWDDLQASAVIAAMLECLANGHELDLTSLTRWIRIHLNESDAVIDCLQLDPPEEISILQLLSRAGSQKLVFLANWEIAQQEVVVKRFIGDSEKLIHRELQPHPLSMTNRNIIETHFLRNQSGEIFLVERRLPTVLNDSWQSHGVQEAANLLRDIANALAFLEDKQLVHGDIKPDNIGFEDGNYILLDFGICRPSEKFAEDVAPTGSLRTRAPEVLLRERPHSHSSDVWALGATVYNSIVERYPLFDFGEHPPRVSAGEERKAFEGVLEARVREEWSRVNLVLVPDPLREVLAKALQRNPDERLSAADLFELAEKELAAFLRVHEGPSRFSPREELDQLKTYLPERSVLELMPYSQKHDLVRRLEVLRSAKGITAEQVNQIEQLRALVQ
jgi:serine/threonine protein kinase